MEIQIFGPPGCGKTTKLAREIRRAIEKYGKDSIIVASYTRTAAHEIGGRDTGLDKERCGTLHSLCYRSMTNVKVAETKIKEFNEEHPSLAVSSASESMDEASFDIPVKGEGDRLLNELNILRNKMVPGELWPVDVANFESIWSKWKEQNGYTDYTDMIEFGLKYIDRPPFGATIGFFDEVQDFTKLQLALIRKWGKQLDFFILAGDDDQCQPAGTMIEMASGSMPIEALGESGSGILAYDKKGSYIVGKKEKLEYRSAARAYSGSMHEVSIGDKKTKATTNHIWLTKWADEAKGKTVVYMMKRGEDFRIGWCQLFRADGCDHLGVRARIEKADAAWILSAHDSRAEAAMQESFLAAEYGITTATFEPPHGTSYTKEGLDGLFEKLRAEARSRAEKVLDDHGREAEYPYWEASKMYERLGGKTISETRSCNLMPGMMLLPVRHKDGVEWEHFKKTEEYFDGTVYSLDVPKYNTYIADGIVTHNCIYSFSGATPEAFLSEEVKDEHKIILNQSYRVPRAVQVAAEQWIKQVQVRQIKEYRPRDEEGLVTTCRASYKEPAALVKAMKAHAEAGQSVMILGACSYMLAPVVAQLRREGLPFHNPHRRSRGDWNPLGGSGHGTSTRDRILAYLEPAGPRVGAAAIWTPVQLAAWVELCQAKDMLVRGGKERIKEAAGQEHDLKQLMQLYTANFKKEALDEAIKLNLDFITGNVMTAKKNVVMYIADVIKNLGTEAIKEEPKIQVGTIHSVKGGQADVVYLLPDISMNGEKAYVDKGSEGHDAIIRQFYVGMTRCRQELHICQPATQRYVRGMIS